MFSFPLPLSQLPATSTFFLPKLCGGIDDKHHLGIHHHHVFRSVYQRCLSPPLKLQDEESRFIHAKGHCKVLTKLPQFRCLLLSHQTAFEQAVLKNPTMMSLGKATVDPSGFFFNTMATDLNIHTCRDESRYCKKMPLKYNNCCCANSEISAQFQLFIG